MMKAKYILTIVLAALLTACGSKKADGTEQPGNAILEIPERVDMGEFEGPYYKKFVNIEFKNTGTDTLYILSAVADCDCTELEVINDMLTPNSTGFIKAFLDLSGYPQGETEKQFFVLSNNKKAKSVYVTLVGRKK